MGKEVSPWDVLVEQADGSCIHVVERSQLVMGSLDRFEFEEIRFDLLVELVRVTGIDCLIVVFEITVFEIFINFHCSIKVDWRLSNTGVSISSIIYACIF